MLFPLECMDGFTINMLQYYIESIGESTNNIVVQGSMVYLSCYCQDYIYSLLIMYPFFEGECDSEYFNWPCKNTKKCIRGKSDRCNARDDCGDGSDESSFANCCE